MSDDVRHRSERRPYILLVVVAVALVYLLAFALLNTVTVHVSFVAFSTDAALIWVMLISALLGLVIGAAGVFLLGRRRR
jgi:uncharacterized integral membrane protein